MSRLLWLADVARGAGLNVVEVSGWQQRGAAAMNSRPLVVVAHHTATSARAAGDYPSLGIVRDGRPGLSGPLSQYGLGRSGTVYVIASGKANHAGVGHWKGTSRSTDAIGIEAESPGDGTWTAEQRDAYPRLAAAILAHLGRDETHLCAHREWAQPPGRKPDPTGISMTEMRARVAALLNAPPVPLTYFDAEDIVTALPVLSAPSRHENARTVQALLNAAASVGLCPEVTIDGDFGPRTRQALVTYQTRMGLQPNGATDRPTWRALLALGQEAAA